MTLLSKFIDVITSTFASATVGVDTYRALTHSLGSSPDLVIPCPVSVANASCSPVLLGVGGNASQATVGLAVSTLNVDAAPTVCFKAICWVVHSLVR